MSASHERILTFWDDRFGDRYVITVSADGHFLHALRYLDSNPNGTGHEYFNFDELPRGVRFNIETFLRNQK